jgi:N6-adenosine-specific RNA methylase IME4
MKYNTIVIDPPWPISLQGKVNRRSNTKTKLPYSTLTFKQICDFSIKDFAEKGAHIYLWTTNKFLRKAFEVFDSWKVNFHLVLVMVKPSGIAPSMGYVFGIEFCLLGFYGKPMQKFQDIGKLNWFKGFNKAGNHSSKPDEFYNLVEKMSPSQRIDIFSRKNRKNWSVWGNEIGKFNIADGQEKPKVEK